MVLDCFVGSGTTPIAAIRDGRRYLGIELMPHYAALASERCRNAQTYFTAHTANEIALS